MRARCPTLGQRQAEYDALIEWARRHGKLLPFTHIEQFSRVSTGAEHVVYHDFQRGLAIKATHVNSFGHSVRFEGARATPVEYLDRLAYHNALFGDDIRIEGVAYEEGQLEVVTSQSWIRADSEDPNPEQGEIDRFFAERGFEPAGINPDAPMYFNAGLKLLAADAHNENIIRDENGNFVAIDVVIGRRDEPPAWNPTPSAT